MATFYLEAIENTTIALKNTVHLLLEQPCTELMIQAYRTLTRMVVQLL